MGGDKGMGVRMLGGGEVWGRRRIIGEVGVGGERSDSVLIWGSFVL